MDSATPSRRFLSGLVWLLLPAVAVGVYRDGPSYSPVQPALPDVLGPVASVVEATSGVEFAARVDTGAAVTSLHCGADDFVIQNESADPRDNVAKPIRLRVHNRAGDSVWIDTQITDYVEVRSANGAEHRYRVRLPLRCRGVSRHAIVNLKDRSSMTYRMLLGRDFLDGAFLVDVSRPHPSIN